MQAAVPRVLPFTRGLPQSQYVHRLAEPDNNGSKNVCPSPVCGKERGANFCILVFCLAHASSEWATFLGGPPPSLTTEGPIALSAAVSTVAFLFFHPHYTHPRPSEHPMRDAVWRLGSIHFSLLMIRKEGSSEAVFTNLLSEKCTAKFQSQFRQ